MARGSKGTVRIYFDGDTRRLESASKRAQKSVGGVGKAGLASAKNLARIGLAAGGIVGVTAFAKSATSTTISLAKSTAGLARVTGMETEAASRWVAVAKTRQIEGAALTRLFVKLSQSMTDAADGGEKTSKAFEQLGVSQETLKSGDTSAVLVEMADAFQKLEDGPRKSALAQQLFGRQAQQLVPLLNSGSDALREQLALSDKFGTTMSKKQVDAALKAAAAQRKWNMALDGIRIVFATSVLPALTTGIEAVAEFVSKTREGEGPLGSFVGVVKKAFDRVKSIITEAAGAYNNEGTLGGLLPDTRTFGQKFADAISAGIKAADLPGIISAGIKQAGTAFQDGNLGEVIAQGLLDSMVTLMDPGFWIKNIGTIVTLALAATKVGWLAKIPLLGPALKGLGNFIIRTLGFVLRGAGRFLVGVGKELGNMIMSGLSKLPGSAASLAEIAVKALWGRFRNWFGRLRSGGGELADRILDGIESGGGKFAKAAGWLLGKLWGAIKGGVGIVLRAGRWIADKAIDGIKDKTASVAGVGKWLISRIGDGISDGVKSLAKLGKTIANTIINAVKSALGIKSPSVVFQQIGKFMVQGLARGIRPGNVRGVLGKAFGGTTKFVKAMVKKGFASIGGLPSALAGLFGGGGGESSSSGLVPQVKRALSFAKKHGWKGGVNSGFRSREKQAALYEAYLNGTGNLAAPPGNSSHEKGQAVDVSDTEGFARAMAMAPGNARLYRRVPGEPWHFSVTGHARGGKVTSPMFVMGEEAPRFPEYVISTNPRDRGSNIGYLLEAAGDLGIPGFKKGKKPKKKKPTRAQKTARAVRGFNRTAERQDALDAAYEDPKYNVDLQARINKIDQLLKLRKMTFEDRTALLNMRGQLSQQLAGDGAGGDAAVSDDSELINAINALNETNQSLRDQSKAVLDYAKAVSTATNDVTENAMKDIASKQLGGWFASMALTMSPKVQIA